MTVTQRQIRAGAPSAEAAIRGLIWPCPLAGAQVMLRRSGLSFMTCSRTPVRCGHRPCALRHGPAGRPHERRGLQGALGAPRRGAANMAGCPFTHWFTHQVKTLLLPSAHSAGGGPPQPAPAPLRKLSLAQQAEWCRPPLWGASGLGRRLPRWGDPVSAPAFGDADDPGILVRFPDRRLLTEHLRCSYSSSVRHTGPDWGLIPGSKIKIKQNFGTFSSFSSRGCFW